MCGLDTRECGCEVGGGEDGFMCRGIGIEPLAGEMEHFVGGEAFSGHVCYGLRLEVGEIAGSRARGGGCCARKRCKRDRLKIRERVE